MARIGDTLIDRLLFRRSLRRWHDIAESAPATDLESLRLQRSRARGLRREIDRLIHAAEYRLALPLIGSDAMKKPLGTDWSWRPDLWRGQIPVPGQAAVPGHTQVCEGATIFHDCQSSELTFRQIRNTRPSAPIRTVVRTMPWKVLPYIDFSPQTPYASSIPCGSSDSRGTDSSCLSRKAS